jgi:asparagine synthase (glutamine-hydrolysing)
MSGLACLFDRRGAPVTARRIERLGASLADYGGSSSVHCEGPLGIVVRHPEDARSRLRHGPLRDERSGITVAVAGRFALVDEPASTYIRRFGDPAEVGFAQWLLQRWPGTGLACLDEIAGSFTLIVAEPERGRLSIVRDHLGDLKVYYHVSDDLLIAATEASAVLDDGVVTPEPDERSVARFLGFRFGHSERGFYRGVRELAAAHLLRVDEHGAAAKQYWQLRHSPVHVAEEEVEELLVDHLRRSVRHHLAGLPIDQVGLSLSGGIDSTAIAAAAPPGLRAYSWRFDTTPDPAEQANIEAVSRHLELPVRWIAGDGHGPLAGDFVTSFVHPSSPYVNPFAGLKRELYSQALSDGCRRMVVGDAGDVLYGAGQWWLRDALTDRQGWVLTSLVRTVGRALRGDPFSRASLLRLVPGRRLARSLRGNPKPPWLTTAGAGLLPSEELSPVLPEGAAARRYDACVGARNIELESEERRLFFHCGIDRANPFWHRPLIDMVLGLPAYRLARDGRDKVVMREAMADRLPEGVVTSPRVGLLGDFFLAGIAARRDLIAEILFRRPQSDWRRYVRQEWLEPHLAATDSIDFGHTILWRAISYELWFRRVWGNDDDLAKLDEPEV